MGSDFDPPSPLPPALERGARALIGERGPWEAEIPLERSRALGLPTLVVSGAHHPAFDAICDALERALGAERLVVAGHGHNPQLDPAFTAALLAFVVATPKSEQECLTEVRHRGFGRALALQHRPHEQRRVTTSATASRRSANTPVVASPASFVVLLRAGGGSVRLASTSRSTSAWIFRASRSPKSSGSSCSARSGGNDAGKAVDVELDDTLGLARGP